MLERHERARRGRTLPFLAALLVAVGLLTAEAASATPTWRGAQAHPFGMGDGRSEEDNLRELDKLAEAGANTVRMDFHWAGIEPNRGRIDDRYQEKADRFIAAANARGIKPIVNLHSTPCWASSDPAKDCGDGSWGSEWFAPDEPSGFGEIAAYVADRYEGRIAALELWNEPDLRYFMEVDHLVGSGGEEAARAIRARQYAEMVKAAYPRVKQAAPSVEVLVGAIEGTDTDFLKELYARGIAGDYDAISVHPYNGPDSPASDRPGHEEQYVFRTGVPRVHDVMEDEAGGGKVWLTEFGWSTCTDGDYNCLDSNDREAGEREQGAYIEEAFHLIDREFPYVEGATAYELRNSREGNCRECEYGLLREDFSQKPAYTAFKRALAPGDESPDESSGSEDDRSGASREKAYREAVEGTAGLLSYWRLGESSGQEANDRMNLADGSYSRRVSLDQNGIRGAGGNSAASMNDTDRVSVSDRSAYDLDAFTVELWVKLRAYGDTDDYRPLIRKGDAADNRTFGLFLENETRGRVHFSMGTGSGWISETSTTNLELDRWYHLALVHPAGGRPALYINGRLDAQAGAGGVPATGSAPILIRSDYAGGDKAPAGRVDEVAIYRQPLRPWLVSQHHAAGSRRP